VEKAATNGVVQADRVHVLQRLRNLRDWARFIHESVRADQPFETGTRDLLRAYMGEGFLSEFDSDGAKMVERLEKMIQNIEDSAIPAARAAIFSR
jgi:hypothetical protein